jgi:hypothetical protein
VQFDLQKLLAAIANRMGAGTMHAFHFMFHFNRQFMSIAVWSFLRLSESWRWTTQPPFCWRMR